MDVLVDLMLDLLLREEVFVVDWVVEDEEDVDLIDVVFVFEVDDDESDLIEFIFCGEKLLVLFCCSMFQQMTLSLVLW